jgi:hypothetical protein
MLNCSPVSTKPPITTEVWAFCKTNSGRRSRPRPPILSLEQPWKGAKAPQTPWDPWGRQNYCKPKQHYLVLAASGASDQDVWGVYGCNFSWRFQWHHRRPWPTSAAGDIADLSSSTFSYPWQLPTSMASLFLSLAINLSPVSLSPAIIGHRCQQKIYPWYQQHRRSLKIRDKD